MAIIADSIIFDLAVATAFIGTCLYLFFTSTFNYWKDRGIPYIKPVPILGSVKEQFLQTKTLSDLYQGFYDAMKGERYFGMFEIKRPVLVVRDPYLVEKMLTKDFNHFYDRGFPGDIEHDPLSANLFNLEGKEWRNLRYKLTPTFTTGKLKGMFEQICVCGGGLVKIIEEESNKNKPIESKPLLSSFTFEIIGSVAFGLQLNKDNEDSKSFRKVVDATFQPSRLQLLRFILILLSPKYSRKLGIKQFPKHLEDIVMNLVKGILAYRRSSGVNRNDFLQLLLNLQKQEKEGTLNFQKDIDHSPEEDDVIDQMDLAANGHEEEDLQDKTKVFMTDSMVAAQCFIFLTAGSESVSSTVNFALYSLTQYPAIQEKVQMEIDTVLAHNNNEWSYRAVKEMTYLEQVVQETLRLYPVAPILFRVCTETYKVPDSTLIIEKGTRVSIPVMAIHKDPQYHDSPEVFDPDRFYGNNFKPSATYFPFGDGPRICIAMRFAVLEVKVVLARILDQYSVKLSPKTKLPLKFNKKSFLLMPEEGFWFEFDKRIKI